MDTDKKIELEEQEQRERYADHLQADFYATKSGLNEVLEYYCSINDLSAAEEDDAYDIFSMEQACGINGLGSDHKLISDLCWRIASGEKDLNFLAERFGSNLNRN